MSALTHEIYPKVLSAISLVAEGRTVSIACDEVGISVRAFKTAVAGSDELTSMLSEAEQRGYDAMADALLEIDRHTVYGHSDPRMAKIASDNIKWFLSKKNARVYGDRVQVDVNITADKIIADALDRAKVRSLSAAGSAIIDVTPDVIDAGVTLIETDEEIMAKLLS